MVAVTALKTDEARAVGVDTVAALRAVTLLKHQILVRGSAAAGDGGGGLYYWASASTATDDGAGVVKPTSVAAGSGGRWLRAPLWGGVGSVDLAADVSNANATANTLQDITGLSFPVLANVPAAFRFQIAYTAAATTTGARFTINGPAFTTLAYSSRYPLTATTETLNFGLAAYGSPAAANASSLSSGNVAIIEGVILPSASGTVIARFASEVASSAIVAKAGSSVTYW